MANTPKQMQYRMGVESTDAWGTAVAQTVKLMDVETLDFTPIVTGMQIKDQRGTLVPGYKSVLTEIRAEASLGGWLNVEQCPYWFNSLLSDKTPTTDADGNTWAWEAPVASSDGLPAINSFTIAKGIETDANSIKAITGATVNSMNLSGAVNEPLRIQLGLIGKGISTDTFDACADSTTQILTGCNVALYVDPDSDAVGTTAISTTGFDFSLDINANRSTFGHLGSCQHTAYKEAGFEGALTLGLELNATSAAYFDDVINAGTSGLVKKVVRVLAQVDTDNYVQVDFNGVINEAPQFAADRDGVSTLNFTLNGQYGATLGNWLKVEARNATESF